MVCARSAAAFDWRCSEKVNNTTSQRRRGETQQTPSSVEVSQQAQLPHVLNRRVEGRCDRGLRQLTSTSVVTTQKGPQRV
jgi:hypothetical protein